MKQNIVLTLLVVVILAFAVLNDLRPAAPKPDPVVLFQPDTIQIGVGGYMFRYGTLTVFGEDTVSVNAFLQEPTGGQDGKN
jgi:hypothetical protein